jgi:hypothetical protein
VAMEGMAMKLVTAVIKPHRLDAVKEALQALGVAGLTVWPEPARLAADLGRVAVGGPSVVQRLRAAGRPLAGRAATPVVVWHRNAATDAVIMEVRAADSPGLLFRMATALEQAGAVVRARRGATSARASRPRRAATTGRCAPTPE